MMANNEVTKNKDSKVWKKIREGYSNWLFMMPFIIGFCVFIAYPIVMSMYYSFTDFNGISIRRIGLFNYESILNFGKYGLEQQVFKSFLQTFKYTLISIPINVVLSYCLALMLHKSVPGIKLIRLLFYLPVLIPGIVFGQIWIDMLGYPKGLVNQWLNGMGLSSMTFFSSEYTQLSTLIGISQWTIGGGMIIWLAALSNVPQTLYEASELDGAGFFTRLFKITIPICTPIIFYNVIALTIMCLQVFDSYAYLGRGINDVTYFISIRIYLTAFGEAHQYGLACSMAWLLFVIIGILTAVMFKTSKWVFYGDN